MTTPPSSPAPTDTAAAGQIAALTGVLVPDAARPGVAANLQVISAVVAPLLAVTLPAETGSAPVFVP